MQICTVATQMSGISHLHKLFLYNIGRYVTRLPVGLPWSVKAHLFHKDNEHIRSAVRGNSKHALLQLLTTVFDLEETCQACVDVDRVVANTR